MIRITLFVLLLAVSLPAPAEAGAQSTEAIPGETVDSARPASASDKASPTPGIPALPAMSFVSSIADDELLAIFKGDPAFSVLDEELAGSPLTLVITHTARPEGGQAAGFLTAVLSGSTLGLIPIVSKERLVMRYEVLLNGKAIVSYSFERTATRSTNLWTAGKDDGYHGLGKAGMDWLRATTMEAAAKVAADPALAAVKREIDYFFGPDLGPVPDEG